MTRLPMEPRYIQLVIRICTHASHHASSALNSWWSSFHCRMMQIDAAEQLLPVWHQGTGLGIMVTRHMCPVSLWWIFGGFIGVEKSSNNGENYTSNSSIWIIK